MNLKPAWELLHDTMAQWSRDDAVTLAAAVAYYAVLSLAPLLVVVIAVASLVFGQEDVQARVIENVGQHIGREGAQAVSAMIQRVSRPATGLIATAISIGTILLGASAVFAQLQNGLNRVWDVPPRPGWGVVGMIRNRFASFLVVVLMGVLLVASLVLSAALGAVGKWFGDALPGFERVLELAHFGLSLGILIVLFALLFKILPDRRIDWSDVWVGAVVTALLFSLGQTLIGFYLGRSAVSSIYGAAGSLVLILVWVYYSAQIFFFGAELAHAYAKRYGSQSMAMPPPMLTETPHM